MMMSASFRFVSLANSPAIFTNASRFLSAFDLKSLIAMWIFVLPRSGRHCLESTTPLRYLLYRFVVDGPFFGATFFGAIGFFEGIAGARYPELLTYLGFNPMFGSYPAIEPASASDGTFFNILFFRIALGSARPLRNMRLSNATTYGVMSSWTISDAM